MTLFQWRLARVYRRWVLSAIDEPKRRRWLAAGAIGVVLFNATVVLRFFLGELGGYGHPVLQALVVYPSGMFIGTLTFGFLLVTLLDVGRLLSWSSRAVLRRFTPATRDADQTESQPDAEFSRGRRRFLRLSGASAIAAIGATPVLASVTTTRDYELNRVPLRFPALPRALEGFTIAQISDIHSGVFMTEANMREIFELANSMSPNLTVITGDLVDSSDSQIPDLFRAAEVLNADYGIFACLGNHDHYATADKVAAAMEQRGITMLTNDHRRLAIDGAALELIGIDDAGRGSRNYARLDDALSGVDAESLKVLLSHRPDIFPDVKRTDIDLTLSGHTHGGQVGIEVFGLDLNPVYLLHRYARGLYTEDAKHIYVNVGVGMVGAPIRLVRPEISLFSLHRGDPAHDSGRHPFA
jgi:hypothetical protein